MTSNTSKLKDHKLYKKKGLVASPFNDKLGDVISLTSWTKNRMPEYLWLGLILDQYGRTDGMKKTQSLLHEIANFTDSINHPRLSDILRLNDNEQEKIYKIISTHVDSVVISPLTIICNIEKYPTFYEFFNQCNISVEQRLDTLSNAIKIYSPHQSDEATDLRYLAMNLLLFKGKIHISDNCPNVFDAYKNYPNTEHSDPKMSSYRPSIRSSEGIDLNFIETPDGPQIIPIDTSFADYFWREMGLISSCETFSIDHKSNTNDYAEFIEKFQKIIHFITVENKDKSLSEDKFDVIVGSSTYALKIFKEIHDNSLGNSIISRMGIRTIIEVYIILKYLLKKEEKIPKIWEEYKIYGMGNYKLILLKAREKEAKETSHFVPFIADILVNEIKWEEFIDIDLKYFNKTGIREKSIEIGEKDLFDTYYDYDSNFAHGLWGAVRESSMLACNNSCHFNHIVPDSHCAQNLPDTMTDCLDTMSKLLDLLDDLFKIPESLMP
jgi:Family of unknown function (DUF5677)